MVQPSLFAVFMLVIANLDYAVRIVHFLHILAHNYTHWLLIRYVGSLLKGATYRVSGFCITALGSSHTARAPIQHT